MKLTSHQKRHHAADMARDCFLRAAAALTEYPTKGVVAFALIEGAIGMAKLAECDDDEQSGLAQVMAMLRQTREQDDAPSLDPGHERLGLAFPHDEIVNARCGQKEVDRLRTELAAVTKQRDELAEALEPFARHAKHWAACRDEELSKQMPRTIGATIGDIRRASAALAKVKP